MRVVGYDLYRSEENAKRMGVEKVDLDELLRRADFISINTPMTAATRNIIGADANNKTKQGLQIINCTRGDLVDELPLAATLQTGHVAGAALDVFMQEPATDNILFDFDAVVATPHLGASTVEAQEKVALQVAEQMAEYLTTGALTNALNIATFHLGRRDVGGEAVALVEIDGMVPVEVLDQIKALRQLVRADILQFSQLH